MERSNHKKHIRPKIFKMTSLSSLMALEFVIHCKIRVIMSYHKFFSMFNQFCAAYFEAPLVCLCILDHVCTLKWCGWMKFLLMYSKNFSILHSRYYSYWWWVYPDSRVHGANMGPIWGRQDPGGPHIGPMNLAIWVVLPEHSGFSTSIVNLKLIILQLTVKFIFILTSFYILSLKLLYWYQHHSRRFSISQKAIVFGCSQQVQLVVAMPTDH